MQKRILTACIASLLFLVTSQTARAVDTTLSEVWERGGGARLYYDALMRPRQINMNGARWEDPALNRRLPPLHEPVRRTAVRR